MPYLRTRSIDYHCHILPGIDDGSPTMAESVAMAEQLYISGFSCVHCTPHCITGLFDTSPAQVSRAVVALQQAVNDAGIPLRLQAGMEYYVDDIFFARLDDPLTLGDTNLLLFEISPSSNLILLQKAIAQIKQRGLVPLLAHPERYPFLMPKKKAFAFTQRFINPNHDHKTIFADKFPPLVDEILDMGCLFQGNIGSFGGLYGRAVQLVANMHQQKNHYHYYGSDGHSSKQLLKSLRGLDLLHSSVEQ